MNEYKHRHLEQQIRSAARSFKIIVVLGARQVGKSTLLRALYPMEELFLFDSILDPYRVQDDPDLFLDLHPPPLLLDEVQFVPALLSAIKRRVDQSEAMGGYFLTGSQNLNVLKSVSETMTGRAAILHLEAMSLVERLGLALEQCWLVRYLNNPSQFLLERPQPLQGLPPLVEVLWRGSLPRAIELPRSEIPLFFHSYIQTYVERDLRLVEKISDLHLFGEFLSVLGTLSGQEINSAQLGREIGITPQTAKRWVFALTASYQWRDILPLYRNAIKRVSERRKGVFTDSGVVCHLLRMRSPEDLALHSALGAVFETWVVNHIHQLFSATSLYPAVYHWRSHGGAEIDLILEIGGIYFPIEIKCSRNLSAHDLRSFKAFRETYPERKIAPGLIIHAGDDSYLLDRETMALSWKAL